MKRTVSLKSDRQFRRIYAKGKSAAGSALVVYARRGSARGGRLGLTVSTKVGCAVVRNRVRRRLREIYRLHEDEIAPGYDIVLVARVRAANTRYARLEEQFLSLCGKLGLLRGV